MNHSHPLYRLPSFIAAAAGLIALVVAQPAGAEIVHTPINVVVTNSQSYALDLNNDGTTDFIIKATRNIDHNCSTNPGLKASLSVTLTSGNGVEGATQAARLATGSVIGAAQTFKSTGHPLIESVRYGDFYICPGLRCECVFENIEQGAWLNRSGYLGLEVQISGQTHYGWAHLAVKFNPTIKVFSATITGYAYETNPGQSIVAGQTSGTYESRDP